MGGVEGLVRQLMVIRLMLFLLHVVSNKSAVPSEEDAAWVQQRDTQNTFEGALIKEIIH